MIELLIVPLATLAGVAMTLYATDRREAKRLQQERFLKLREDKLRAYTTLVTTMEKVNAADPSTEDISNAYTVIALLADDEGIRKKAAELRDLVMDLRDLAHKIHTEGKSARSSQELIEKAEAADAMRDRFVEQARRELADEATSVAHRG